MSVVSHATVTAPHATSNAPKLIIRCSPRRVRLAPFFYSVGFSDAIPRGDPRGPMGIPHVSTSTHSRKRVTSRGRPMDVPRMSDGCPADIRLTCMASDATHRLLCLLVCPLVCLPLCLLSDTHGDDMHDKRRQIAHIAAFHRRMPHFAERVLPRAVGFVCASTLVITLPPPGSVE